MASEHEPFVSRQKEIANVSNYAPHLVILGAGGSRAAMPNGDAAGRLLPVMADFASIVPGVGEMIGPDTQNFEEAYAALAADPARAEDCERLEGLVYQYFDALQLPDRPGIYDHLVAALRPKDVIATFNWDPFLIQAVRRSKYLKGGYPRLIFLHGNTWVGFCHQDKTLGTRRTRCSTCGRPFVPSRLLYPVAQKDYQSDPDIAAMWKELETVLRRAFMVTIFGYGAPSSDVEAVSILQRGWGKWDERQFEQFEVIDVLPREVVRNRWRGFIHTHHYEVHDDFYKSWIAQHPRRTGEAYWSQYMDANFLEANPIPRDASFEDLEEWLEPLLAAEREVASQS